MNCCSDLDEIKSPSGEKHLYKWDPHLNTTYRPMRADGNKPHC